MNHPDPEEAPVRSLGRRRALMVTFAGVALAGFVPMLLLYKGLIDAESFGVSDSFFTNFHSRPIMVQVGVRSSSRDDSR
jgi:hypothetical protein